MKKCVKALVTQSCLTLCDSMDCKLPGSSLHRDSPGKNTRVGYYVLLQGFFPIQGSNPGVQHCKWILYHLSHQGSPRILEWVVYPFSRGFSQPRNWTCIANGIYTIWEACQSQCYINSMWWCCYSYYYQLSVSWLPTQKCRLKEM